MYLWTQVTLAGGVASASGLAGLPSSPWGAGSRGWGGAEVREASTARAGLGWRLGPPSPPLCTSAQVLTPPDLPDVPSRALAPAPPCTRPADMCVHACVTPCPHARLPRPGLLLPLSPPHSLWVQGLGEVRAGSTPRSRVKGKMPQGPGGSQDSFGVTAGGTLGHTRGTLEPKEALGPTGGWKPSRGWERFQPVSVGPADLGAGGGLGPGLPSGTDAPLTPPSAPDVPHLTPLPSPCSRGRLPLPSGRAHPGGLRARAPLLTGDPTLNLVGC